MTALPNKLSDLLELAVRDAQACAAMPELYTLDMSNWHFGRARQGAVHCNVCMAGAVMAQTLKLEPSAHVNVWEGHPVDVAIVERNREALSAINHMRTGHMQDAFNALFRPVATAAQAEALDSASDAIRDTFTSGREDEDEDEPDFASDAFGARASWESYLTAAGILREAGL